MPPSLEDHPGNQIARELGARGWTQMDLAFILNVSSSTVSHIVTGRKAISAADSKALGEAFGMPEDHFLALQKRYDLETAEGPSPVVRKRAMVQQKYPLREMIRRGWIEEESDESVDSSVARFFGQATIEEVPHLAHAARKTNYEDSISPTQLAWLYRVMQLSREMITPHYSERKLRESLPVLSDLRARVDGVRHVPRILDDAGVRFVIVESLPGGKIDGVCLWLTHKAPVIGMSLRFDRIDNFWFVLRHEIEHVLNKDGLKSPIIDSDLGMGIEGLSNEEILANIAASDFCVPKDQLDSFYARKYPLISRKDVYGFAHRTGVHPGLVVGQLQYKMNKWNFLRNEQVPIRHLIQNVALTDGWGDVIPVYH